MKQFFKTEWPILVAAILTLICWLVFVPLSHGQVIGDGLPEKTGTTTPRNVTYSAPDGRIVSEVFNAPDLVRDFAPVQYIDTSPIDSGRVLDRLPTFGLALWHWWLFGSEVLPHAQKDYAKCVGEIRGYQKLLGISPLLDEPGSPVYDTVNMIVHYLVPFQVVERFDYLGGPTVPPGIEEAKAHARAAIDSINITVFHRMLCEQTAEYFRGLVWAKMQRKK